VAERSEDRAHVTHDVDEALFLSDRIVMMTNGRKPKLARSSKLNFPAAPSQEVMEHPDYYGLREHLITFLEERAQKKGATVEHDNPDARGADWS